MKYCQYINGELFIERVAISKIASEIGTPFYCYSSTKIETEYKEFSNAFSKINSLSFTYDIILLQSTYTGLFNPEVNVK